MTTKFEKELTRVFSSLEWKEALTEVFGCHPNQLPLSNAEFPSVNTNLFPNQLGPEITNLKI